MGACADIVPGVSGGTIAFITGIYEELINSIKAVDLEALKLLLSGKFAAFWSKINGGFLIVLLLGILTSILSLARIITNLLANHPIQLWSFFFGLIAISALVVSRDIHRWNITVVLGVLVGGIAAYLITEAVPAETPNSLPLIFLSGAVAICAMILPGISGSFILLILGKYTFILTAIKEFQLGTLLVFSLGCLLGLMTFSRLISWLFEKYRNLTIAVLAGFMVGSLNKVWPWKKTVETYRGPTRGTKTLGPGKHTAHNLSINGSRALLLASPVVLRTGNWPGGTSGETSSQLEKCLIL